MLSALHSLDRAGDHAQVSAKISQYLKAVEQSCLMKGDWRLAWMRTGLPEFHQDSVYRHGLSHPAEFAASISYLKEARILEDAVKQTQSGYGNRQRKPDGGGGNGGAPKEPWWKKKKNKKTQETGAASSGGAKSGGGQM